MAVVTSPMLLLMAYSKSFQGFLNSHIASHTQMPAEKSRATWLAPRMESLPNMPIFRERSITRTMIGTSDMQVLMSEARFILFRIAQPGIQPKMFLCMRETMLSSDSLSTTKLMLI